MPFEPEKPFPKSRGDSLRSTDWNDLVTEIQRLDTDKVNRAGDAMTGTLTIDGSLSVGTTEPKAKLEVKGDVKLQDSVAVREFSADVSLSDNSHAAVPTERAIKEYVDNLLVTSHGFLSDLPLGTILPWHRDLDPTKKPSLPLGAK